MSLTNPCVVTLCSVSLMMSGSEVMISCWMTGGVIWMILVTKGVVSIRNDTHHSMHLPLSTSHSGLVDQQCIQTTLTGVG